MKNILKIIFLVTFIFYCTSIFSQQNNLLKIARLKYAGGGDWYEGPSTIPNFITEVKKRTNIKIYEKEEIVSVNSKDIFNYQFIFMTGHGNVFFTDKEAKNLQTYLLNGGFLYADDDYGMDVSFRREVKKIFPDKKLIEVPFSHPIYHSFYDFNQGLPKIHEHYPGPPKGLAIIHKGKIILFYTYNTNISDGWESAEVHKDPAYKREQAFKMGINILVYALNR